jgi:hypothetical protein
LKLDVKRNPSFDENKTEILVRFCTSTPCPLIQWPSTWGTQKNLAKTLKIVKKKKKKKNIVLSAE